MEYRANASTPSGDRDPSRQSTIIGRCAVCGSAHHGTHFGILSCRACASFFRRTITERKTYSCRRQSKCDILEQGMRNACRACRLQRCLAAGMNANIEASSVYSLPTISIHSPPSMSADGQQRLPIATIEITKKPTPTLDRYLNGLKNFISGQRSLFTMEHMESVCSSSLHKLKNVSEFMRLERGTVTLLDIMLSTYFGDYARVTHSQRVSLLKYYSQFFLLLYRMHLSALVFHDDNPPSRFVFHYGCYVDETTMNAAFFEGSLGEDMNRIQVEEHVRFTNDFLRQLFAYVARFRRLELHEHELVMVMANIFWSSVEKLNIFMPNMDSSRDKLFAEIHNFCLTTYGPEAGPVRLGRLMAYAQEILINVIDMSESFMVARIFLSNLPDVWDEPNTPNNKGADEAAGGGVSGGLAPIAVVYAAAEAQPAPTLVYPPSSTSVVLRAPVVTLIPEQFPHLRQSMAPDDSGLELERLS